jgi:hypothetical protein
MILIFAVYVVVRVLFMEMMRIVVQLILMSVVYVMVPELCMNVNVLIYRMIIVIARSPSMAAGMLYGVMYCPS